MKRRIQLGFGMCAAVMLSAGPVLAEHEACAGSSKMGPEVVASVSVTTTHESSEHLVELTASLELPLIDHGDGTATDRRSGVTWIIDLSSIEGLSTMTWDGAMQFCDSLEYAGYSDWRLPNVREIQSIFAYIRTNPGLPIWAQSPDTTNTNLAWIVGDGGKMKGGVHKDARWIAWPVRGPSHSCPSE